MPSIDQFPPAIRRQIAAQLGHASERQAAAVFDGAVAAGREIKDLHEPFITFLRARGLAYLHSNPSQKATVQRGHPDFEVYLPGARTVFVEFKTGAGRVSKDQLDRIETLVGLGFPVLVARSLHDAERFVLDALETGGCAIA